MFWSGHTYSCCHHHPGEESGSSEHGVIYYHDIGDYLTREEKLSIVASSVPGEPFEWDIIEPDRHGDWLNQRDDSWYDFAPLGMEGKPNKKPDGLFRLFSLGVSTIETLGFMDLADARY